MENAGRSSPVTARWFDEAWIEEMSHSLVRLIEELWPLGRSLTGEGNRRTLEILSSLIPGLEVREIPSRTSVFDWIVPEEWEINEGWIRTPSGEKICDLSVNNLHVVGYSQPIEAKLSKSELERHLHSLPEQPRAIPYVTSYYEPNWGFCISHEERESLPEGDYEVCIRSRLFPGSMTLADVVIPGETDQEVLLSTYICHPSMANNELSGIAVATGLIQWLRSLPRRRLTYRFVFVPETVGTIAYLSENLHHLQEKVIAGSVLTCVGDDRSYSFVPSRQGDSLADLAATAALRQIDPFFKYYTWADRQSDERQYCAPHVNLPVASIMRTKYGEYDEYHTSLDTVGDVVTQGGIGGALLAYMRALQIIEHNYLPIVTTICEPQLGRRGLYPNLSMKGAYAETKLMRELLSWSDGSHSVLDLADLTGATFREVLDTLLILEAEGLIDFET